jgi:hypothetical protein
VFIKQKGMKEAKPQYTPENSVMGLKLSEPNHKEMFVVAVR